MSVDTDAGLYERPAELLQRLIRFDTTNPPGNERACVEWIAGVLRDAGFDPRILAKDAERPNLIARLQGQGLAPPLLLQGHIDVVPAQGSWSRPPFGGEIAEGSVWGRGALDMKSGVAMMLAAFLRAAAADAPPPGDVLLCVLSDEEAGGDHGARFLVEEHAELLDDVRFAIGEFGGFTMAFAGRRFYPVMVAEKQLCSVRATLHGPAGHGSLPVRDGAMGRLGRLLGALDRRRLPVHVTPVVRSMVDAIAAEMSAVAAVPLRTLLRPRLTDRVLDGLGDRASFLDPLLHNTASPTIVRGGHAANVIPDEVSLNLDCRLLPGFGPDDVFEELRALARVDMELELLRHDPGPPSPDMALRHACWSPPGARSRRTARTPAAAGGDRRPLLRQARHSDLRVPPHAAASGDAVHGAHPRRGRANPGGQRGVRHQRRPPAARAVWASDRTLPREISTFHQAAPGRDTPGQRVMQRRST
jgi:acetylornithine deacetylase/succinyl-diaminopimelate desuccinylase-like protein